MTDRPDIDALAAALHDSLPCRWQAHAGFIAWTDAEYHQQQIDRLAAAGWTLRRTDEPDALALLDRWVESYAAGYPAGLLMASEVDDDTRAYLASKEQGGCPTPFCNRRLGHSGKHDAFGERQQGAER